MGLAGKNILVTGGTGFLGSHLVQNLLNSGAKLIVTDEGEKDLSSYFYQNRLNEKSILVNCDLKNFDRTFHVITRHEIDYVYHLAAQAIVNTALINPLETYRSNILGTLNVLESCRLYGKIEGVIVASSDKSYGKTPRVSEKNPLGGDHPYESSKSAADLIAQTYFVTYKLPVVITRFGNTYGEGDLNFNRIIPGIMKALVNRETLGIRSNGKFIRDYVYVSDIVSSLILILKNIKTVRGEVFNVSSRENLSVLEIIKTVGRILDKKINYKILNNTVNEIPIQSVNFNKIQKVLGWKPKYSLKTTIPGIFDWYSSYFAES